MGLQLQGIAQSDKKTRNCLGADTSVGGFIMKGPLVTAFTPATTDSTNGIQDFYEHNGNLFAMAGRYVLKYVSDSSWTVSKDFGAGVNILHGCVFASGGGTPAAAVFLA